MSVDSKMFVTCGKDKMFEVINSVIEELNILSRAKLDEYLPVCGYTHRIQYKKDEHDKKYTNGCRFYGHSADCIIFLFGVGDTNIRSLNLYPDCSCDTKDICDGDTVVCVESETHMVLVG